MSIVTTAPARGKRTDAAATPQAPVPDDFDAERAVAKPVDEPSDPRVGALFSEIASIAAQLDRWFYWRSGDLDKDGEEESVSLEIARLRSEICRMGWLADLGGGFSDSHYGPIRGCDATDWLLTPVCRNIVQGSAS